MPTDDELKVFLKGIVQRAVDNSGCPMPEKCRDNIVASIVADAEWEQRARAIWGTPK